jgi:hypothetical protein
MDPGNPSGPALVLAHGPPRVSPNRYPLSVTDIGAHPSAPPPFFFLGPDFSPETESSPVNSPS